MEKNIISLFSGCGGMDLGFEGDFEVFSNCINPDINKNWGTINDNGKVLLKKNNYNLIMANDIVKDFKTAWLSHFSSKYSNAEEIYIVESVVDIVKKAKNSDFRIPDNVDIVTGGFPCQDFSVAGKRMGMSTNKSHLGKKEHTQNNENRGMLYYWLKEFIGLADPKVFVAENVKGLLSIPNALATIQKDFSNINEGFAIAPVRVLNAKNYGVPQNRERVIFLGFNKKYIKSAEIIKNIENGNINVYPEPTHGDFLAPFTKTQHVFEDLLSPILSEDLSQKKYSKAKYIKGYQGNTLVNPDGVSPTIRAEHHGNIEYRFLNTNCEEENRRLSVRECARLQTFPDSYQFVIPKNKYNKGISASSGYKTIGNAVPPLLAYHIARKLEEVWGDIFD